MKKLCISLVLMFCLVGIASAQKAAASSLSKHDAVCLVVFKELVEPWLPQPAPSSSGYIVQAFYFAMEGRKDPSDRLIKALGPIRLPAKKASGSFISTEDGDVVLDRKTRERGVLFSIFKLRWINHDEAEVSAGNREGNMSAYGCTYTVKRKNEGWWIAKSANCTIS